MYFNYYYYQGKVNEYPEDIGLTNNFRNILWEKKKKIDFFDNFLYFL